MRTVQLRDAKATFSARVDAAERGEPTTITRHGKAAAMVVPMDVARRLYPDEKPNFADFLMSFPACDNHRSCLHGVKRPDRQSGQPAHLEGKRPLLDDPAGSRRDSNPLFEQAYCSTEDRRQSMTPDDFRQAALSLPGVSEGSHMSHPDFRVEQKVFATLGYPDEAWGMVKLTPEQQEMLVAAEPATFEPVKGVWGKKGSTQVRLERLDGSTAGSALRLAWSNVTPGAAAGPSER